MFTVSRHLLVKYGTCDIRRLTGRCGILWLSHHYRAHDGTGTREQTARNSALWQEIGLRWRHLVIVHLIEYLPLLLSVSFSPPPLRGRTPALHLSACPEHYFLHVWGLNDLKNKALRLSRFFFFFSIFIWTTWRLFQRGLGQNTWIRNIT